MRNTLFIATAALLAIAPAAAFAKSENLTLQSLQHRSALGTDQAANLDADAASFKLSNSSAPETGAYAPLAGSGRDTSEFRGMMFGD